MSITDPVAQHIANVIADYRGEALTVAEIADAAQVGPGAVLNAIGSIVDAGLAARVGTDTTPRWASIPQPSWTKSCRCGAEVSRWPGESYPSCPDCGADYNAFGQRLRDGWQGNTSNYDDEVGDMEGYEAQQVEADEFYESRQWA